MQAETAGSWGDAFMASLTDALSLLLAAIPRIVGFLLILLVGWVIAKALGRGAAALLRAAKFDDLARRARFHELTSRLGTDSDAAGLAGAVVKWLLLIVTFLVAFDALGLPEISNLFEALLLWIPNLIVAIAVLFLAGLVAAPLGNVVRGAAAEGGFSSPEALAKAARIGVWLFAAVVALTQLGIAENLIYALFYGFVAALALAFGLGARETAGAIVDRWYRAAQPDGRSRGSGGSADSTASSGGGGPVEPGPAAGGPAGGGP